MGWPTHYGYPTIGMWQPKQWLTPCPTSGPTPMPYRSSGRGSFLVDLHIPGLGRVRRASGTYSVSTFDTYMARLRQLRDLNRLDVFRALQAGRVTVVQACAVLKGRPLPRLGSVRPSWVYVVQIRGPRGPVKIGLATNVAFRVAGLQGANPDPVRLIAKYPGGRELEQSVHRRFHHLHLRGEWFRMSTEIRSLVADWSAQFPVTTRRVQPPPTPAEMEHHRREALRRYWLKKSNSNHDREV